jgi:RNA polymerase subunit RPABC4/transcription elongation factor Spt4
MFLKPYLYLDSNLEKRTFELFRTRIHNTEEERLAQRATLQRLSAETFLVLLSVYLTCRGAKLRETWQGLVLLSVYLTCRGAKLRETWRGLVLLSVYLTCRGAMLRETWRGLVLPTKHRPDQQPEDNIYRKKWCKNSRYGKRE